MSISSSIIVPKYTFTPPPPWKFMAMTLKKQVFFVFKNSFIYISIWIECFSPVLVPITWMFTPSLDIACGQEKKVLSNGFLCQSLCPVLVAAAPLGNFPLTTYKV